MPDAHRYRHKNKWRTTQRQAILRRDRYCRLCGNPGTDGKGKGLIQAHLISHAQGGSDDASNIVLLCPACHRTYDAQQQQAQRGAR